MLESLLWAGGGTGFTCSMTALGAAMVFFFRKQVSAALEHAFLGFAAGVMVAASVWSLLLPAMDLAAELGLPVLLPAGGGFLLGVLFLLGMDRLIPHLHAVLGVREGLPSPLGRSALLVLAMTLHNIPEGMAVGLSFALAAQGEGELAGAAALALGIGIQNFPEGAALSLPLRQAGRSRGRAFATGALSGVVEPLFGLLAVLAAGQVQPVMPWLLSFAAGSMLYVVVEELIPQANIDPRSDWGTMGAMGGFLVMMALDVALG